MSARSRKIIFVIRALNVGGAERQLIELAGGMRRAGWNVKLATFYGGGSFEPFLAAQGVPHISLKKRGRWEVLPFLYRLLMLIRAERPDVVYSMLTMSNVLLGLLAPLLGSTRVVWGVAASNMDLSYYDWLAKVESALEVRLAKGADLIISNSYAGRDYHIGRGYPAARTVVVCNGIDTETFKPDETARLQIRHEWGIAPHEKLVGVIGRLDPIKDHANFLAAAKQVAAVRPEVRFACVGDGSPEHRSALVSLAATLGVEDRVLWVSERTDIARIYNAFDVVVSSSISEGLANVIAEALATGVRCAATAVGDSARLLGNPRWLAPPCDSNALAAAILNVIDDPSFDPHAARGRIVSELGLQRLIENTIRELTRILDGRVRAPRAPTAADAPKVMLVTRRLEIGGAERQLVELATGLHQAGWNVVVVTFYAGGALAPHLYDAGVGVLSVNKRGRWDVLGFGWRLVALIRRHRPDVLHGYLNTSNVLLTVLRPFVGAARIVWGVRASNMDLTDYDWLAAMESRLARRLSHYADLIICNSEAGRAHHIAQGYPAGRMVVVPNGVDPQKFSPDPAARREIRAEWNVRAGEVLVGHVARLDPMKDHRNFLRAAAIVAPIRPAVRFVCVGDGPEPYRSELAEEARALGIEGRVIWAGPRHDMPKVYNALDVAVSSSAYGEGFSNTIVEAMATGVPCVVTDVGDSGAIVGTLGWVCAPRDSVALGRGMLEAVDALPIDGERIREHAITTYSSAALVDRSIAILAQLVSPRAAVSGAPAGGTR